MTRQNSGVGWVLMADVESVDKAIEYYMSGEVLKINIFTIDTQFSYNKRLIYAHLIPH